MDEKNDTTPAEGAAIEVDETEVRMTESERQRLEIENRYCYHAPKGDQPERYQRIRAKILETAALIVDLTPGSREQSVALTALDTAMFNANAAIARNE